MDTSIMEIRETRSISLSYYISQCFQHIYFTTSTLWGKDGIFGTDPILIDPDIGTFR